MPSARPLSWKTTIAQLEEALRSEGTTSRAEKEKAYLKSDLAFVGANVPTVRRLARDLCRKHQDVPIHDMLRLVRQLWKTRTFELRSAGIFILARRADELLMTDLPLVEDMLRRGKTWAHVDWISTSVLAPLAERFAGVRKQLDRFAKDEDFWLRRASMLALVPALRAGAGDFRRFERYATPMLGETEFFIRKAIGWVLRETSKTQPELAQDFLQRHIGAVSGLTLREGSKYLLPSVRASLRARYDER